MKFCALIIDLVRAPVVVTNSFGIISTNDGTPESDMLAPDSP